MQAYILIFRGVPGGAKPPAPPTRALSEGGDSWRRGVLLILHLPQAIYILHCIAFTQTKSFKKRIKYILIHNITLQSFVWSSIIKYPCFPFWKLIFLFVVSPQKWLGISCFRNEGEMKVLKVHRTCHSINGGSLEITHVFHLSIITSCDKKIL